MNRLSLKTVGFAAAVVASLVMLPKAQTQAGAPTTSPSSRTDTRGHAQPDQAKSGMVEWRNYAGDKASSKYSPLMQINKNNFKDLKIAWTWHSADEAILKANSQ